MAMLDKDSFREAQPSELSLFELPPTQTAVERITFEENRPVSHLSGSSPIEFHISGQNGMEYVDLKRCRLHVKAKVKKSDGTAMSASEETGPVNLFMHSLFEQIDVFLSGKLVSSHTANYPYKSMMLSLLKYGKDANSTQLLSQLFIKDSAGNMDAVNAKTGANTGLFDRRQFVEESKTVEMIGPILHDVFLQDRYLLNQVDVVVRLYRTKPSFCLISGETTPNYDVIIEDIVLEACKVKVNPAVVYGQAQILQSVTAKYPYTKSQVKTMAIPQGSVTFVWDNLFQGTSPSRVVVGFVSAQALAGSYDKNPYNFQSFDLQQINLTVDGVSVERGGPTKLNFTTTTGKVVMTPYVNMFDSMGMLNSNVGNSITIEDFVNGYALFCYDLQPTFGDRTSFLQLLKQGNVRLEAQFGTALPETVCCVVYSETPALFKINQQRDVITE